MNDKDLKTLFDDAVPTVNEIAKKRSKQAAMAAFRKECKGNNSISGEEQAELSTSTSVKKVWFSGLAASCVLAVGLASFNVSKLENVPDSVGELEDHIPQGSYTNEARDDADALSKPMVISEGQKNVKSNVARPTSPMPKEKKEGYLLVEEKSESASMPMRSAKKMKHVKPAKKVAEPKLLIPSQEVSTTNDETLQQDEGSYSSIRDQIHRGVIPDKNFISTEALVSYFKYAYLKPEARSEPLRVTIVVSNSPWSKGNKLIHIAIQGYEQPKLSVDSALQNSGLALSEEALLIAKDVQFNINFNPKVVSQYRVVSYETKKQNNGGKYSEERFVGAVNDGFSLTTIYELTLMSGNAQSNKESLKRGRVSMPDIMDSKEGVYGVLSLSYTLPKQSHVRQVNKTIDERFNLEEDVNLLESIHLSTAVAAFAQKLKGQSYMDDYSYTDVIKLVPLSNRSDMDGPKSDFIYLLQKMQNLNSNSR